MDPYLEGSEWVSVHAELSSEIARQLAPKLRPKYIVRTIYDALNYDLSVNDAQPPEIPLEAEAAVWASDLLKDAGKR
jgi:hypothetical protein